MDYRKEIDGLRALAVIPVVLFHAGFDTFSGGYAGVDVFFVISGYLITSIILAQKQAGTFKLLHFYERRARRILPALFLVMFACLPLAWVWLVPTDMKFFSQSLVAVIGFASNIFFWAKSGYFDAASELKPLLHTWSLAVEEQYYLLFPVFLVAVWRYGRGPILAMLAIMACASLLFAQWSSTDAQASGFYLLPGRAWELLIGVLAAFCLAREPAIVYKTQLRQFGSLLGLFLIGYAVFVFDKDTPFPSFYALLPTIGTALIILFATAQTLVGRVLGHKVLVGIGLISYSTYLWHQPLFAFARHRTLDEPGKLVLGSLALGAVILAWFTWKYVETPFRNGRNFSRKQIFSYAGACAVLLLLFGLAGNYSHGFSELKTTPALRTVFDTAKRSPNAGCHTAGANYLKPEQSCEYQTGALSWATIGDSHSVELAYALSESLQASGGSLKHFSFSGCVPAFEREMDGVYAHCAKWTKEVIDYIVADKRIRNVLVSYRIHAAVPGAFENVNPAMPAAVVVTAAERGRRWDAYVQLQRHLVKHGKRVVLVLQAPQLPKHVNDLLFRAADPTRDVLGMQRKRWDERADFVSRRLGELPSEVKIVDPAEVLCGDVNCLAARDGVAYYYDGYHMSVAGARLVLAKLMQPASP
jgi:peptidoglycan/LPS O-acetylase OafA/YrhL